MLRKQASKGISGKWQLPSQLGFFLFCALFIDNFPVFRCRYGNFINDNNPHLRTRTNTNPNDTEANAAGRSGNARALRKQCKCGVYHEGEGHWPKFSQKL